MNAQWNARLPTSRAMPCPPRAPRDQDPVRRGTSAGAACGGPPRSPGRGVGDRHPAYCGNASISRACIGGVRTARQSALVLGARHATSETNSSVTSRTNHHDPKTSNSPARSKNPQNGWVGPQRTRSGVFGHWGSSDPATEATAIISSKISAVRIERRVRQTRATDWRT